MHGDLAMANGSEIGTSYCTAVLYEITRTAVDLQLYCCTGTAVPVDLPDYCCRSTAVVYCAAAAARGHDIYMLARSTTAVPIATQLY